MVVVAGVGLMVALAALDVAVGGTTLLVDLFILGPLLTAARGTPRATAVVAAIAVVLAVVVGTLGGMLSSADDWLRVVLVGVGGCIAIWIASLRAGTEAAERSEHAARLELQVMLESVADAITAQDSTGRLVYANDAAVQSMGFASREELLATPPAEVLDRFEMLEPDGRPFDLAALPGRMALSGQTPPPTTVRFRVKATGEDRYVVVKARPVLAGGKPVMAINVMEDVTEHKELEQRQRFLADLSAALAESLDYATTKRAVVRLAVPAVADHAAVEETVPEDAPERATSVRAVLATGEAQLTPRLIVAPMVARGRTIAALSLARDTGAAPYDERDLDVAVEVGRRAGLALANAELYSERAHTARALQESLLPPVLPAIPGLEVASRFRAAGTGVVGGDFYDLFEVGAGGWALVVGDVCGKGPDAAAVTALARYTIRAGAMYRSYPSHILSLLNDALLRQRPRADFCTVALGRFDVRSDGAVLVLATGGHPPPLLMTAAGEVHPIGTPGTLLGVLPDPELRDDAIELDPGDVVVFYTDGVTEAGAPRRILDSDALSSLVAEHHDLDPAELAARIERAAVDATEGELRDDIAILVARVRGREVGSGTIAEEARVQAGQAALG
jgi:PAS domain S-box-containing protein